VTREMFVRVIEKQEKLKREWKSGINAGSWRRSFLDRAERGLVGWLLLERCPESTRLKEDGSNDVLQMKQLIACLRSHTWRAKTKGSSQIKTVLIEYHSKKAGHKRLLRIAEETG
jgi:hypothetical protein